MKTRILKHIQFLFGVHVIALAFFMLFRIVLLFTQLTQLNNLPDKYSLLFKALLMGLRFDNVISCYIIILPLIILTITSTFKFEKKFVYRFVIVYLSVFYVLSFFICAADIPYFEQFYKRINSSVFNWIENFDFVFKMIIQQKIYFVYFTVFLLISILFIFIIRKIGRHFILNTVISEFGLPAKYYRLVNLSISVFFIGLCAVGIRGRIEKKSPILVGTAFFSNYSFPNQLGLNPVFCLMRDMMDSLSKENKVFNVMKDSEAIQNVLNYFSIKDTIGLYSPVTRKSKPDSIAPLRKNVVYILMEGMSAEFMQTHGQEKKLTPFLDSIVKQSYYFENIYSAGIHTMNGLYAALYGFPSLLKQHPLRKVNIDRYNGIAGILADNEYNTIYFTTHDDQFDNVGGFFRYNGFERIISQKDYPGNKVLSALGVPDDFMFDFSIPVLNDLAGKDKPFFATFLTTYNHIPSVLPDYFTSKFKAERDQLVEYSDWALYKFFEQCKKQKWFENTIFIFTADHGCVVGNDLYDMPLSYHHSPLIMYSKDFLEPTLFKQFGGQIDIFPTILGILHEPYINTSLGIDLLNEKRPYTYFSADDKIGCIDSNYFFVYYADSREVLYDLKKKEKVNYIDSFPDIAKSMKKYAFSMLQTTQWLLLNEKTGGKK